MITWLRERLGVDDHSERLARLENDFSLLTGRYNDLLAYTTGLERDVTGWVAHAGAMHRSLEVLQRAEIERQQARLEMEPPLTDALHRIRNQINSSIGSTS